MHPTLVYVFYKKWRNNMRINVIHENQWHISIHEIYKKTVNSRLYCFDNRKTLVRLAWFECTLFLLDHETDSRRLVARGIHFYFLILLFDDVTLWVVAPEVENESLHFRFLKIYVSDDLHHRKTNHLLHVKNVKQLSIIYLLYIILAEKFAT